MKKISCVLILILLGLVACSGGSGDSNGGESAMRTLALDEPATDTIYANGDVDVDWYEFNAVEYGRTLTVTLVSAYTDSPVDFMLTVYEKDANGKLIPIFGQSAPEDVHDPANLRINVGIDKPKRLYFAVRDFNDDDSSDQIQYKITVTYSDEVAPNGSFADAIVVPVGAGQQCNADESIFPKDDTDFFRFDVASPGVYRIGAQYDLNENTVMKVNLGLELYNDSGELIYQFMGQRPGGYNYVVLANLDAAGTYYLVVNDQGKDNESEYNYTLCIEPVAVDEHAQNDTSGSPESRVADAEGYNLDGALEYIQDEDWYALPIPASSGATSQNIRINFHNGFGGQIPPELSNQFEPDKYRIEVQDADGNVLHAYDHPVTATASYNVEIAAGPGAQNFIVVKPVISQQMLVAMPYQLRVQTMEVSDPGEENDPLALNNTGQTVTGKIYKLGDVDNFTIDVDTTTEPKVLEVKFDTDQPSEVAYNVRVMYSGKNYILRDINGTENGTHFKSSYYLPASGAATSVTLMVSDDQNNDGADLTYTLDVGVLAIPSGVSPNTEEAAKAGSAFYFDETVERAAGSETSTDVTVVEYDTHGQPEFKANTTKLKVGPVDGSNEWRSDWITGFADYDGDRDIFKLDFSDVTGSQQVWYFNVQVRLFAAGSDVEYSWALFRDRQPNGTLLERTFWGGQNGAVLEYDEDAEGVVAYQCDDDLTGQSFDSTVPANLTSPAEDEHLWLGHVWGQNHFYLSIQDFNKALLEKVPSQSGEGEDGVPNQVPDNDWGNTNSGPEVRPYYFQVVVKYFPLCSYPGHTGDGCVQ